MNIHWWWRRAQRIRNAEKKTQSELEVSERLYEESRETVEIAAQLAQRNMFADIIRQALVEGYGGHREPPGKAGTG